IRASPSSLGRTQLRGGCLLPDDWTEEGGAKYMVVTGVVHQGPAPKLMRRSAEPKTRPPDPAAAWSRSYNLPVSGSGPGCTLTTGSCGSTASITTSGPSSGSTGD